MSDLLSSRYIRHLRQQNKTVERFVCPQCPGGKAYREEPFWRHIDHEHQGLASTEESKTNLRQKALAQPPQSSQLGSSKAGPFHEATLHRDSSNDSMRNHADKQSRPQTPSQPTASDLTTHRIGRLSLDHKEDQTTVPRPKPDPEPGPIATSPSRKRPASSDVQRADTEELTKPSPQARLLTKQGKRPISDPQALRKQDDGRPDPLRAGPRQKQLFDPYSTLPGNRAEVEPRQPVILPRLDKSSPVKSQRVASKAAVTAKEAHDGIRPRGILELPSKARYPDMILQPDSRPISNDQLAAEVKGIYAGLVIVEAKCMNIDAAQTTEEGRKAKLNNEQWHALIALHRTLLYEHHDFLLASQHPSASPELRRSASEHSMPFRMWKHAIHSFLEVLRQHLPESIDYMLNFIYLSYQMMALLYETVPLFEDTWIECLGDLARYRMAIEEDDLKDRDVWGGVARFWYSKASDRNPAVGRLYHHLGLLARPNALQQLFYYCKSLTSVQPFYNARESIMTLFNPVLGRSQLTTTYGQALDSTFVKVHALMFAKSSVEDISLVQSQYTSYLAQQNGRINPKWKEQGAFMAIANASAWFGYGAQQDMLRLTYVPSKVEQKVQDNDLLTTLANPMAITYSTLEFSLQQLGDRNVLPHIHIVLAFLHSLSRLVDRNDNVRSLLAPAPWSSLVSFLNALGKLEPITSRIEVAVHKQSFLRPEKGDVRPLPEDYLMRGLVWCQSYFESDWFPGHDDEESRLLEFASTSRIRAERVLWLGVCLASRLDFIRYDSTTKAFSVASSETLATTEVKADDAMDETSRTEEASQDTKTSTMKRDDSLPKDAALKQEANSTEQVSDQEITIKSEEIRNDGLPVAEAVTKAKRVFEADPDSKTNTKPGLAKRSSEPPVRVVDEDPDVMDVSTY